MNLYEFYVDGDKFYDIRIKELALIDPKLELSLNCAGTLTFTLPPKHPKYDSFNPLTSTIEIYRDGEWFWEGKIIDESRDFDNNKTYTIEGSLGYLNDSIQPQTEYHDITPIGYVERLLNVHNSMVDDNRRINLGAVTVKDTNDSLYCYTNFNSTLQELKEDIIDDLGGNIRVRKLNGELYLDILEDYLGTCSQVIRIGENLIDLTPTFDYTSIKSVIIPLGATVEQQEDYEEGLDALDKYVTIEDVNDGKNYIARQDLLDRYGKIWGVVQFQDVHVPDNLLRKAEKYLTDGQWGEMVIEAKAFDLNCTDEEFQEFRLGYRVRLKSDYHGIDRYFPITAQIIYFNDISENTITLGGTGEPVSITGVTNEVTINTEKLDERIREPNNLIQLAVNQATQLINQGLNGYVRIDGNEILIMDTDDPATAKYVWRWNMGGLGYSNNGYNGPFETAMTMDGTIVGKFLAANSVVAEQIDINYRSHVEQQITNAEDNANDYTDGKLKNYWTSKETEVQFKTNYDSILSSVSSTYATRDSVGNLQERIQSTEQKITEDGIFTTINNGIKGSKSISNTKFSMTKDGLTIQGGGLTIKNNSGINVFYADSSGNINITGVFRINYSSGNPYMILDKDGLNFYQDGSNTSSNRVSLFQQDSISISGSRAVDVLVGGIESFHADSNLISIGNLGTTREYSLRLGHINSINLIKYSYYEGREYSYTGYTGTKDSNSSLQFVDGICVG